MQLSLDVCCLTFTSSFWLLHFSSSRPFSFALLLFPLSSSQHAFCLFEGSLSSKLNLISSKKKTHVTTWPTLHAWERKREQRDNRSLLRFTLASLAQGFLGGWKITNQSDHIFTPRTRKQQLGPVILLVFSLC